MSDLFGKLRESIQQVRAESRERPRSQYVDEDLIDPYEVLELQPSASSEGIRRAYLRLVAEYHPDKVATLGSELQARAEKKTKQITNAYSALTSGRR
jgi:preprotein translocase subunit Sec63